MSKSRRKKTKSKVKSRKRAPRTTQVSPVKVKEMALPPSTVARVVLPPGTVPVVSTYPSEREVVIVPVKKKKTWWDYLLYG